ncbi:MAG: nucleotidyltransferase family protein [Actinomycetota bacterium]|nr:nucleotidyltransferase family protein [Actinomycetota bacterium]
MKDEHAGLKREADDDAGLRAVLSDVVDAVEGEGIPYLAIGGLASATYGRPRPTKDIDVFVKPEDAERCLKALESAGFRTEEPKEDWLLKAYKDEVLVDVIFRIHNSIYLDDDMIARARRHQVKGTTVKLVPAEDFIVMQAVTHSEDTPHYWYNALTVIASAEIDWDYVVRRSSHGPRRVLSLLLYAQSNDLPVPDKVIRQIYDQVHAV